MDVANATADALLDLHAGLKSPEIKFQLAADDFVSLSRLRASLDRHDQLLAAERKQHAEDDNPNLADKLAPAVQRAWQVKVHKLPLAAALPLSDELMSAMGGKQTLGGEETAEGTAQQVNRSSGMGYRSDRPADQLKREARRFQENLRRALAKPSGKPTKPE